MTAAAFHGTYADFRHVKTRGVVQIVVEVPIERADQALAVLGGFPKPAEERWLGIALLNTTIEKAPVAQPERPERAKRKWDEMSRSQQAGVLCNDPEFQKYVEASSAEEAAAHVREVCGVGSRAGLDNPEAGFFTAADQWDQIVTDFRQATGRETWVR